MTMVISIISNTMKITFLESNTKVTEEGSRRYDCHFELIQSMLDISYIQGRNETETGYMMNLLNLHL